MARAREGWSTRLMCPCSSPGSFQIVSLLQLVGCRLFVGARPPAFSDDLHRWGWRDVRDHWQALLPLQKRMPHPLIDRVL
jgi:hypothetical protein